MAAVTEGGQNVAFCVIGLFMWQLLFANGSL